MATPCSCRRRAPSSRTRGVALSCGLCWFVAACYVCAPISVSLLCLSHACRYVLFGQARWGITFQKSACCCSRITSPKPPTASPSVPTLARRHGGQHQGRGHRALCGPQEALLSWASMIKCNPRHLLLHPPSARSPQPWVLLPRKTELLCWAFGSLAPPRLRLSANGATCSSWSKSQRHLPEEPRMQS